MDIQEFSKEGETIRTLTTQELMDLSKLGNIQAIRELIILKGGWSQLTAAQRDKVTQLILKFSVDL